MFDDFSSGSIDGAKWSFDDGSEPGAHAVVVSGGDNALSINYPGNVNSGSAGFWSGQFYSVDSWVREKNLTCTFTLWGDTAVFGANSHPHSGCVGPFHNAGSGIMHNTIRGGINERSVEEQRPSFSGTSWGTHAATVQFRFVDMGGGQSLRDFFIAADGRPNAVIYRITVGNTDGMRFEASPNTQPPSFVLAADSRDTGQERSDSPLWLGFSTPVGAMLLDDVILENDDNIHTPAPTETPEPNTGVEDWEDLE